MTDTLITIAAIGVASIVWFGIQTLSWYAGLGKFGDYRTNRGLTVTALILSPVFVFVVLGVRFLLGSSGSIAELFLIPLAVAWIILLSWAGLRVAARLRGISLPQVQTRSAKPDGI